MSERTNLVYQYDGTMNGFYCCVFESFEAKERPAMIVGGEEEMLTLLPVKRIYTNEARARRVEKSIHSRISADAHAFIARAFLTCLPDREVHMLNFLRLGYRVGGRIMDMMTDDAVYPLHKAILHLDREAHLFLGFVRFKSLNGALLSVIEPKNRVLSIIAPHFLDRFGMETFMIYDKTHAEALVYQSGRHEIMPLKALDLEKAYETVEYFANLWQAYYVAIGIKERENARCRMSHMPKRYWSNLTEFQ